MAKKKSKIQKEIILRVILLALMIVIFLTIISILIALNASQKIEKDEEKRISNNVMATYEEIEENANTEEIEKLKGMNERNRIEYYISKFMSYAGNGEYEKAYNLLNREYRQKYFPTEASFAEYAKGTFTKMLDVKYTNFERNGNIYVSWVTLTDAINGKKDSGKEINFVVKENNYNDFELSFSKE